MPDIVKRYEREPDGFFDAEEYYDIADYYESVIDTDTAFTVLFKGVSNYPDDFSLRFETARLYVVTGNLDEAGKALKLLHKDKRITDPSDILALNVLTAKLHVENAEITQLEKDIRNMSSWVKGIKREEAVNALIEIISSIFQAFLYKHAIKAVNKALTIFPDEIGLYESLIECHLKDGQNYKEAAKAAEKAIDVDPYNAQLWFKLGFIHRFDGNLQEALKAFDYATSINERFYEAWRAMGDCQNKLENYEAAADCYIKGIDPDNDSVQLLINIGDMYNNCDQYSEARRYYKEAININDSESEALFGIGMSYFLDSDSKPANFEKAIFWFKRALNENDSNAFYWNMLGNCYYALDNWAHCLYAFHHSLEIDNRQPDVLTKMAQTYYSIEEYADAIDLFYKSLLLDGTDPDVHIGLAASYYALKDYNQAKYYLMQAMERDASLADAFLDINPDAEELVEAVKKLI